MAKILKSINPYNGELIAEYEEYSDSKTHAKIDSADKAFKNWKALSITERLKHFENLHALILKEKPRLALLSTLEMGKLIVEAIAEVEKCAATIGYYIKHAENYLVDEPAEIKAKKAFVAYQPLGVVLGIMPWNFPYWQAFRFAIPTLIAGNTIILKHASNVSGCSIAIEKLFIEAGFPEGIFQSVLVSGSDVGKLISLPEIKAISLTGSTAAGKSVASIAGQYVKKCVLELGGNDPYIVLADADIKKAAEVCAKSRLQNAGQSCVAAKRFIVDAKIYDDFISEFSKIFASKQAGDPQKRETTLAPLMSVKARDDLYKQVQQSINSGAKRLVGNDIGKFDNAFYPASILVDVSPDMPAFNDELFGPVASVIKAKDEKEAITLANKSIYGLGAALFTKDLDKAEKIAKYEIDSGMVFVNDMVRSDGAIPFGGVRESGYGRELSKFGIREFTNIKIVFIN